MGPAALQLMCVGRHCLLGMQQHKQDLLARCTVRTAANQVGFVMRLEGQRLSAALEDFLPDYEFAFEGSGGEVDGMYYHTDRTRQLNAHFGDMLHKIQDLEVKQLYLKFQPALL